MSHARDFLHSLAQALSVLGMYPDGHASRERALDNVYQGLFDLLDSDPRPIFNFLGDEVIYGDHPLREFDNWTWSIRLAKIGVQRLEFRPPVARDDLEGFLERVLKALNREPLDTSESRYLQPDNIRWGQLGVDGERPADTEISEATISFSVGEELQAIEWIHEEVTVGHGLPLAEASAVVRSLALAMHSEEQVLIPLLKLRQYDEYTTQHSMNIAVLSMAMAEWLGFGHDDVRALGIAGLLHDIGKVRIPVEVLTKGGKLTPHERELMNAHPVDGAKIILAADAQLELAAIIAYEHHIMLNGGGYPKVRYPRDCHYGSKLVHVCDVYDALRTKRPYRDGWPADKILAYLEERSGIEFDGKLAHEFTMMIRRWEPTLAVNPMAQAA